MQFHVIEALGRLRATEACDALVAIAERRDFFLAFPAMQALTRDWEPSIAPRLVPLLADELLRAPVIEALGELGDEDVVVPLVELLNASDAPADVIADALAGLHERYERAYGAGDHIAASCAVGHGARARSGSSMRCSESGPIACRVSHGCWGGWRGGGSAGADAAARSRRGSSAGRRGAGPQRRGRRGAAHRAAARGGSGDAAGGAVALGRIGDRRATAAYRPFDDPELAVPAAGALARIGDRDAFEGCWPCSGTVIRRSDSR